MSFGSWRHSSISLSCWSSVNGSDQPIYMNWETLLGSHLSSNILKYPFFLPPSLFSTRSYFSKNILGSLRPPCDLTDD